MQRIKNQLETLEEKINQGMKADRVVAYLFCVVSNLVDELDKKVLTDKK